jgi:3-oxoacyl-[acyl-carrier-protein] synthase-3
VPESISAAATGAAVPLSSPGKAPAPAPRPAAAAPSLRPGAEIAGLGTAVPDTVVGNAPIAARLGIDENWIVSRTGIHERRVAQPGERLFEFAAAAATEALAEAGVAPSDVELVVVATSSSDELMPAVANRVSAAIGACPAACFDVGAACTGFIAALSVACGQIESGRAANVLVIGADLMMPLMDPDDRATAAVFGDGAGAVLMRATGATKIGPIVMRSDGSNADLITISGADRTMRMQGHETFRYAVDRMSEATLEALALSELGLDDIDLFVYHQANARILRAVGERLGITAERVVNCIDRFGNTSAATIPLALAEARRDGTLVPGARVLLGGFGAGLSWGATVVEWGSAA